MALVLESTEDRHPRGHGHYLRGAVSGNATGWRSLRRDCGAGRGAYRPDDFRLDEDRRASRQHCRHAGGVCNRWVIPRGLGDGRHGGEQRALAGLHDAVQRCLRRGPARDSVELVELRRRQPDSRRLRSVDRLGGGNVDHSSCLGDRQRHQSDHGTGWNDEPIVACRCTGRTASASCWSPTIRSGRTTSPPHPAASMLSR